MVGVEPALSKIPVLHGTAHGASRLSLMMAISKLALLGKLFDIGERSLDPAFGIPKAETPHPGHIDHAAAARYFDHLAAHRGVAALAIDLTHFGGFLHMIAYKKVH